MKLIIKIFPVLIVAVLLNGCTTDALLNLSALPAENEKNPLQTKKDLLIEKGLLSGEWVYKNQDDDCDDTTWKQLFYANNYYKSVGSACAVKDVFSVDAERWYIKQHHLFIVNLSPEPNEDIILKYAIVHLDKNKLTLGSNGYNYTFIRKEINSQQK